jgi:hypothetical protein
LRPAVRVIVRTSAKRDVPDRTGGDEA